MLHVIGHQFLFIFVRFIDSAAYLNMRDDGAK